MSKYELMTLFILTVVFIIVAISLETHFRKLNKCKDGEKHDYVFKFNTNGDTGDLGFGMKGVWNIDYYKCSKCGKEHRKERY